MWAVYFVIFYKSEGTNVLWARTENLVLVFDVLGYCRIKDLGMYLGRLRMGWGMDVGMLHVGLNFYSTGNTGRDFTHYVRAGVDLASILHSYNSYVADLQECTQDRRRHLFHVA